MESPMHDILSVCIECVLAFYVPCNDISVIYVTAQMQANWRRSCTYGRAPNAIDIS